MTIVSTGVVFTAPLVEVRCQMCRRLLLRWMRSGEATLDLKCPRCGGRQVVALST